MNKNAEKWLKIYADRLEKIFKPMNKTACKKCNGGCCRCCARSEGYFRYKIYPFQYKNKKMIFIMEEKILQKKINQLKKEYGFSKKYGFLNIKEKRCGLPRYLRSRTCLNFYCHEAISRCNGTGINDICDKMTKIRIKNKLLI